MTQTVVGEKAAAPPRRPELSERAYVVGLSVIVAATAVFRISLGARGSFTGDDFGFRAAMAGPYSVQAVLQGHNGHLNPLGLSLQWLTQHAFPGRFVPLMIVSALLVAVSQTLCGIWVAEVFGRRPLGWVAATISGLSPMLLELSTWWSVALYAAPMVATAWLTVLFTTRYVLGKTPLWAVAIAYALCLGSSTKAVFLPALLLGLVAGLGLGTTQPLGFRLALTRHVRLWATLGGLLALYFVVFVTYRGPIVTASPTISQMWEFVSLLFRNSVFPAVWGGPWEWASLGFHAVPLPSPLAMAISSAMFVAGVVVLLLLRPRTWRVATAAAGYMLLSAASVAVGRAGAAWGGPVLRYTFDLLLPCVLVLCAGLASTRWEAEQRSRWGRRTAQWSGWYPLAGILAVGYVASLIVSYSLPWSILPGVPMKQWVSTARTAYPDLRMGLLEQRAPLEIAPFPEDLDVFLAGDPGKPPEKTFVLDRVLGFDARGRLIQRDVEGLSSLPAQQCTYRAEYGRSALVPLAGDLPEGRHTVLLEYILGLATSVELGLGQGGRVELDLPAGARRAYAVVDGSGREVAIDVLTPNASLCVLNVTVGELVDGPPVRPDGG